MQVSLRNQISDPFRDRIQTKLSTTIPRCVKVSDMNTSVNKLIILNLRDIQILVHQPSKQSTLTGTQHNMQLISEKLGLAKGMFDDKQLKGNRPIDPKPLCKHDYLSGQINRVSEKPYMFTMVYLCLDNSKKCC